MPNCPSPVQASPRRALRVALITCAAIVLAVVAASTAAAADISRAYRNEPGFRCYFWNAVGECTDFSYLHKSAPVRTTVNYVPRPAVQPVKVTRRPFVPVYSTTTYQPQPTYTYAYPTYAPAAFGGTTGYFSGTFTLSPTVPTVVAPSYNMPVTITEPISVRVSGQPRYVGQGEDVLYNLYVRNDGNAERVVDVTAYLDSNMGFVNASVGARKVNDYMVTWPNLRIAGHSSKTTQIQIRVKSNAMKGDIRLRAQAGTSSDSAVTTVTDNYRGSTIYFSEDSNRYPSGALPYRYESIGDVNQQNNGNYWYNDWDGYSIPLYYPGGDNPYSYCDSTHYACRTY
jgi:hypothetical protein